jgi:hypothetical protein
MNDKQEDNKKSQCNDCYDGEHCKGKVIGCECDCIGKQEEWSVNLAEEGTPLAEFQKVRTDAINEMFDAKDESGIYQINRLLSKLDGCFEDLRSKSRDTLIEKIDGMKKKMNEDAEEHERGIPRGYNQALDSVKQIILEVMK